MTLAYAFKFVNIAIYVSFAFLCFILVAYFFVRFYVVLRNGYKKRQIMIIDKYLDSIEKLPSDRGSSHVSKKTLRFFRQHIVELLACLTKRTNKSVNTEVYELLRSEARKFALSKNWLKQYFATQCYHYGFAVADENFVISLVNSETPLVFLNMAEIIFKYPTQNSVNALIDSFSKGRSLNRSLCVDVLVGSVKDVPSEVLGNLISKKLSNTDINIPDNVANYVYIRVFCYQLLSALSNDDVVPFDTLKQDIMHDNVDLSLSAMRYLAVKKMYITDSTSLFIQKLHDKNWQIRSISAKLLGEIHAEGAFAALEPLLEDSVWWVRYNTACALYKLGPKGKEILEKQSSQKKIAYDIAQRVLNIKPQ